MPLSKITALQRRNVQARAVDVGRISHKQSEWPAIRKVSHKTIFEKPFRSCVKVDCTQIKCGMKY